MTKRQKKRPTAAELALKRKNYKGRKRSRAKPKIKRRVRRPRLMLGARRGPMEPASPLKTFSREVTIKGGHEIESIPEPIPLTPEAKPEEGDRRRFGTPSDDPEMAQELRLRDVFIHDIAREGEHD